MLMVRLYYLNIKNYILELYHIMLQIICHMYYCKHVYVRTKLWHRTWMLKSGTLVFPHGPLVPLLDTYRYIYIYTYLSKYSYIYIYMYWYLNVYARPPPHPKTYVLALRWGRQTQRKHVRAILRVENNPAMVRHRQELDLSGDGWWKEVWMRNFRVTNF